MPVNTMKSPDILWAHLRSATNDSNSKRKCPVDISIIPDPKTDMIEFELTAEGTASVCTCAHCAMWMFVAHTCACCGSRERRLFVNPKMKEEAEKRFKDKYGLLRSVEAGENVRNLGRVDFAFKNGDILSIGICCQKKCNDRIFSAIVDGIKRSAGIILSQETRCQAQRRNGESVAQTADAADFADAERHMQELLAMENENPKIADDTALTQHRQSQRKSKRKSRPSAPAQPRNTANSEEIPVGLIEEENPHDAPIEESPQETATLEATRPLVDFADAEHHTQELLENDDENPKAAEDAARTLPRQKQRKSKKKSQPSTPDQSRSMADNVSANESPQDTANEESLQEASAVVATRPLADVVDAERHMQEPMVVEGETPKAVDDVARTPPRQSQRENKRKNQPSMPAQSHNVADRGEYHHRTNEESPPGAANEDNLQEIVTVEATWPIVDADIPEQCLEESNAALIEERHAAQSGEEVQGWIVSEEAGEATDSFAMLDARQWLHELLSLDSSAEVQDSSIPRLQRDECDSCNIFAPQESIEKPLPSAPSLSVKSDLFAGPFQVAESKIGFAEVENLAQTDVFTIDEKMPISDEIISEVVGEANDSFALFGFGHRELQVEQFHCRSNNYMGYGSSGLQGDVYCCQAGQCSQNSFEDPSVDAPLSATESQYCAEVYPVKCSRKSLHNLGPPPSYPPPPPPPPPPRLDRSNPVAAPSSDRGQNTSSFAFSTPPLPFHQCHSVVDAWTPMQPAWDPMQSKLGLWSANHEFLCPRAH